MQFGDLNPVLGKIIELLKRIDRSLGCAACEPPITTAGGSISVPAGLKSVAITKTNGTGTATVTLSDGSTYALTTLGEGISDAASPNFTLPAYTISTGDGATWKWHGIK